MSFKVLLVRDIDLLLNRAAPRQHVALAVVVLAALGAACSDTIEGTAVPPANAAGSGASMPAGGSAGKSSGTGGKGGTSGTGVGGAAGSAGSTPGAGGAGSTGGSGSGGSTAGTSGTSGTSGDPPPVGGGLSDCATPGPRLIRRLTSIQFRNTLVDAFADPANPADPVVPTADVLSDPTVLKFRVDADRPVVRDLDAGLIMNYAETVAAWVVTNKLGSFVTCSTNDSACRRSLITSLAPKLFREPLDETRIGVYDELGSKEATFKEAATQIVGTMLQSPSLLYRRELGTPKAGDPSLYDLSAYEVASELSYFLTDSAPDAELLAAAADGSVLTPAGLDAQAERLLFTAAAKATISRFAMGWFELDGLAGKAKDLNTFQLTDALRVSMVTEAQEFFTYAFAHNWDVASLFNSKETFVDQALGNFYGVNGAPQTGFGQVDLTNTQRAPGMLGQAGFLTAHAQPENSSPVQRGRFVRDRLLCEKIPEIPQDLDTNLADGATFTTNRQRYEQHDKSPACAGCHSQFDPVGFTFEHFDGFGRYREQENNTPIDATGALYMENEDVILDGAESLTSYLAESDQVRACLVRYWSYYAHGRDNWTEKKCNDDAIRREAATKGNTLYGIFEAILHAQTFTRRVKDQ